jgi:hypothetical protein
MAEDLHAFCRLAIEAQDKFIAEQVSALRGLRADVAQRATELLDVGERSELETIVAQLDAILNNVTGVEEEMPPG